MEAAQHVAQLGTLARPAALGGHGVTCGSGLRVS